MVSPRADRVGKLVVREIGTPPELLDGDPHLKLHWLEPGEFRDLPLVRRRDANKGTYGHALMVAGSLGKSGAALLAGRAALRAGAGLVTVATPIDVLPIVAAGMPELMTAPLLATEAGSVSMGNLRLRAVRRHHSRQIRPGHRPGPFDRRRDAAVHPHRGTGHGPARNPGRRRPERLCWASPTNGMCARHRCSRSRHIPAKWLACSASTLPTCRRAGWMWRSKRPHAGMPT